MPVRLNRNLPQRRRIALPLGVVDRDVLSVNIPVRDQTTQSKHKMFAVRLDQQDVLLVRDRHEKIRETHLQFRVQVDFRLLRNEKPTLQDLPLNYQRQELRKPKSRIRQIDPW